MREGVRAYVWLTPWWIGLALFTVGPVVGAVALAFTDYDLLSSPEFAGLDNFERITDDPVFSKALRNTIVFTVFTVVLGLVGSLLVALALNRRGVLPGLARTVLYVPTITPVVVIAVIWTLVLNPIFGVVNLGLEQIAIQGPGWLTDPSWSMASIIIVYLWWTIGGDRMVLFLAGLQSIPKQLYEAALIDGAGSWRRFWHVTLPMLGPVLLLNVVLSLVFSLQVFVTPLILTDGGPANSTMVLLLYIYDTAFEYRNFGYASAMATVFLVLCALLVLLVMLALRRFVHYQGAAR